ncbi:MAG: hypothetical protein NUV98_05115 [Candidatus Roizmanbacteria bacterium]|nr:hypothetical protein [Candidatus Roizmanbacteria bacterium]
MSLCEFDPRNRERFNVNGKPIICNQKRPQELMALSQSVVAGHSITVKMIDEHMCRNGNTADRLTRCPAYWNLSEYRGDSSHAMRVVEQEELRPVEEIGRLRKILEEVSGKESCGDPSAIFSFQKDTTLVTNGFIWGRRAPVATQFGTSVSLTCDAIQLSATRNNSCPDVPASLQWRLVNQEKKGVSAPAEDICERLNKTASGLLSGAEWYIATGEAGLCISHGDHPDMLFFQLDSQQKSVAGEVLLLAEDVDSLSEALLS